MISSFRLDADGYLRSTLLEQFAWLRHGFGTRISQLPATPMATVKQIHSAEILDAAGEPGIRGEADALISAAPGLAVGVKTADCVPILLVDTTHRVVVAVHAGWRGTASRIVGLAVERLARDYETNPTDVYAAIGPAIGKCCYEVGPEVARQFSHWQREFAEATGKCRIDLEQLNALQLKESGVSPGNIDTAGACTSCHLETFFSYRKEAEKAGRMMSWIASL